VPSTTFVIDGYNLMHRLEDIPGESLERRRARLEHALRRFCALRQGCRVILVYDGQPGMAHASRADGSQGGGLEVIFSRSPQRADDLVLDYSRTLQERTQLHVVSSDQLDIGARIGALPLKHWTSESFALHLQGVLRKATPGASGEDPGEKPQRPRGNEVTDWAREFGFPREPREG